MRLQRLVLENYRGFASLDLAFPDGSLCVLIGRNGVGKSTALDACAALLAQICDQALPPSAPSHPLRLRDIRRGASNAMLRLESSEGSVSASIDDRARFSMGTPDYQSMPQLPLIAYFPSERGGLQPSTPSVPTAEGPLDAWRGAFPAHGGDRFRTFVPWFRTQENAENELRLHQDPARRLRSLETVRRALKRFFAVVGGVEIHNPRIMRFDEEGQPLPQGELGFHKGGALLRLSQLSDGEQQVLLLVGELARRLSVANPGTGDPLAAGGVVLIDEIELHLHPGWQRLILPALAEAFPGLQFVVTTHSPQVLASVPGDAVRILEDFQLYAAPPTLGRDSNSLLDSVMGASSRPLHVLEQLARISALIDDDALGEARGMLNRLAVLLSEEDAEIHRLRALLMFLEE